MTPRESRIPSISSSRPSTSQSSSTRLTSTPSRTPSISSSTRPSPSPSTRTRGSSVSKLGISTHSMARDATPSTPFCNKISTTAPSPPRRRPTTPPPNPRMRRNTIASPASPAQKILRSVQRCDNLKKHNVTVEEEIASQGTLHFAPSSHEAANPTTSASRVGSQAAERPQMHTQTQVPGLNLKLEQRNELSRSFRRNTMGGKENASGVRDDFYVSLRQEAVMLGFKGDGGEMGVEVEAEWQREQAERKRRMAGKAVRRLGGRV